MKNPYHLETELKKYILTFEQNTDNYVGYVYKFPNGFGTMACTSPDIYPNWVVHALVFKEEQIVKSPPFVMSEEDTIISINNTFKR